MSSSPSEQCRQAHKETNKKNCWENWKSDIRVPRRVCFPWDVPWTPHEAFRVELACNGKQNLNWNADSSSERKLEKYLLILRSAHQDSLDEKVLKSKNYIIHKDILLSIHKHAIKALISLMWLNVLVAKVSIPENQFRSLLRCEAALRSCGKDKLQASVTGD